MRPCFPSRRGVGVRKPRGATVTPGQSAAGSASRTSSMPQMRSAAACHHNGSAAPHPPPLRCLEPHSRRLIVAAHPAIVDEQRLEHLVGSVAGGARDCLRGDRHDEDGAHVRALQGGARPVRSSRRAVLSSMLAVVACTAGQAAAPQEARAEEAAAAALAPPPAAASEGELYVSAAQGYSLRVPQAWDRKDKAGADVLFEDPQRRSTSVGVTVNRVRVRSIEDFGSVDVVGTRLLEAERKKESTISVTMLRQSSRTQPAAASSSSSSTAAPTTTTLYDFEYELDSTRGRKRILNTVTIAESRLYILNAQYKCDKPKPEDVAAAAVAAGMVVREEPVACLAAPGSIEALRLVAASFGVQPPSQ